jgi:hypothetical protein
MTPMSLLLSAKKSIRVRKSLAGRMRPSRTPTLPTSGPVTTICMLSARVPASAYPAGQVRQWRLQVWRGSAARTLWRLGKQSLGSQQSHLWLRGQLYRQPLRITNSRPARNCFKEAFHEDAWIFFTDAEGNLVRCLISDCFEEWSQPASGKANGRVISVTQAGDIANVLLGWDRPEDAANSYVDLHNLIRLDGLWKITNKTATHSSGPLELERWPFSRKPPVRRRHQRRVPARSPSPRPRQAGLRPRGFPTIRLGLSTPASTSPTSWIDYRGPWRRRACR